MIRLRGLEVRRSHLLLQAGALRSWWRKWRLESVVDAVRPVGRGDRDHELDGLFLGQMLPQSVEVGLLDVPRPAVQEVGKPKDGPLLGGEHVLGQPSPGFLQARDLLLRDSSPPPRDGMGTCSVGAAVQDGDSEVGKLLELG